MQVFPFTLVFSSISCMASLNICWTTDAEKTQRTLLCLFCFDSLRPSQQFSVMSGRIFLFLASTKQSIKCLDQWRNAVPTLPSMRREPATARSQVKHSTIEPLPSIEHYFEKQTKLANNNTYVSRYCTQIDQTQMKFCNSVQQTNNVDSNTPRL